MEDNTKKMEIWLKKRGKVNFTILMIILLLILLLAIIISLSMGKYSVSPTNVVSILLSNIFPVRITWTDTMFRVIMLHRFPRIIAAILVGGALSLSGTTFQGVFRNPLVSPDLLGVSMGACVGAAISILLGFGDIGNILLSFLGGILAVSITVMFPILINNKSTITLVLSGVIVGGFFASILGLLKYIADSDTELAAITYWQLGSLSRMRIDFLLFIAPIIFITGFIIYLLRWRINVISLGDQEAKSLGINLYKERGILIVCSTLLTAAAVCISGTIGWIGLIIPHITRMIVGQDNKKIIPASTIIGASFLIIVDTISRNLTGAEIPLGIITGFVGTPFFAFVLMKQRKKE